LVFTLAIVGPLVAISQIRLRHVAEQARNDVRRTLYFSDMNLALRDWDEANLERCGELLHRHIPRPGQIDDRGFEWYYLWRQWRATQQVKVVVQHDGLETMALSPDGKTLAVGCFDGTIFFADAVTGRELTSWRAHPYVTFALAFSPDGRTLASANIDSEVKLWDVDTQRELVSLSGSRAVAFSPVDGTLACKTGPSISILAEGQTRPRIIENAHGNDEGTGVGDVCFSPDGRVLASAGWDCWVRLWSVGSTILQMEFVAGKSPLWCMDWSPDGAYIATGDVLGVIKLWDASTGTEVRAIEGHNATVASVTFSADSRMLASAGSDNAAKLWEVLTGSEMQRLRGHYGEVNAVTFGPDGGQLLSASSDGCLKSWPLESESASDVLRHPAAATSVAFSPDGQMLATTCSSGHIFLWDATTGSPITDFVAHKNGAWRVRFVTSNENLVLVSTGSDGFVRLWDVDSRQVIREFAARAGELDVLPVAVTLDGSKLAYGDSEFTVRVWDLAQDKALHQFVVGTAGDLAFSPDGRSLAIASGRDIKVRDVATGRDVCQFLGDSRRVERVGFSPDGRTLATGNFDRTVKLWEFDGRRGVSAPHRPHVLKGPAGYLSCIEYSPDGATLASGGADQVVRLWDAASGQQRGVLTGHIAAVVDLAFSPDGTVLASAGDDRTVRLWRAPRVDGDKF
jgi:WD40 repeat protein